MDGGIPVNVSTSNCQHRRIYKTSKKYQKNQNTHSSEYFKHINDVALFILHTIHKEITSLKLYNVKLIQRLQMANNSNQP